MSMPQANASSPLAGTVTGLLGSAVGAMFIGLAALWFIFVLFAHYFFRDPDPCVPAGPNLIVSPGHGKVDVIDETAEPEFMGGFRAPQIGLGD